MQIQKFIIRDAHPDGCQIYWKGLNDYGAKITLYFGEHLSLDELQNLQDAVNTYLKKTLKK